jgi:hypothetical protein
MSNNQSNTKSYDHAWNYFQFHGTQRMTTFNFFVGICSLVAAGSVNLIANPSQSTNYIFVMLLGLFQVILSFLFWKLDRRISIMIKVAEKGLKKYEENFDEEAFRIMLNENELSNRLKDVKTSFFWQKHYSYSKAFNTIFFLFGLIGFLIFCYSIYILSK